MLLLLVLHLQCVTDSQPFCHRSCQREEFMQFVKEICSLHTSDDARQNMLPHLAAKTDEGYHLNNYAHLWRRRGDLLRRCGLPLMLLLLLWLCFRCCLTGVLLLSLLGLTWPFAAGLLDGLRPLSAEAEDGN